MARKLENKFFTKPISELYLNSDIGDVHFEFLIETEQVPAHKFILAIGSPVFRAMFFGPMKKEDEVVKINEINVSVSAFKEFLQFFYLPEVALTMENIETVSRLADEYGMIDCLGICSTFFESQWTDENLIWAYQLSITSNNKQLKRFCERQIEVFPNDDFKSICLVDMLDCDQDTVKNILQLESLPCSEMDLLNASIAWAKSRCIENELDENDSVNLKKQLGDCLRSIRFGAMRKEEINLILSNEQYNCLFTSDELTNLICMKNVRIRESMLFEYKPRSPPALEWKKEKALTCKFRSVRGPFSGTREKIQCQESTWFSANDRVLLGEVGFIMFFRKDEPIRHGDIDCTVTVFEHNGGTSATEVLYTKPFSFSTGVLKSISFEPPIIIQPRKMYEIRFDAISNMNEYYHTSSEFKWEYKLDEEVTIKLHPEQSDERSSFRGLIYEFYFNRIQFQS